MKIYNNPTSYFQNKNNLDEHLIFNRKENLPSRFWIVNGHGSSDISELNSFDNALIDANIGHLNLIYYSSIIPKSSLFQDSKLDIKPGSQTGCIISKEIGIQGKVISSGIAIAETPDYFVVYEGHGLMDKKSLDEQLKNQIQEAISTRGVSLNEILILSQEYTTDKKYGSTIYAIVFDPTSYK